MYVRERSEDNAGIYEFHENNRRTIIANYRDSLISNHEEEFYKMSMNYLKFCHP